MGFRVVAYQTTVPSVFKDIDECETLIRPLNRILFANDDKVLPLMAGQ
tara:strand:- start:200 stop:343 length:144 start_codon:yes stop_codon:yes gene_type:complete